VRQQQHLQELISTHSISENRLVKKVYEDKKRIMSKKANRWNYFDSCKKIPSTVSLYKWPTIFTS